MTKALIIVDMYNADVHKRKDKNKLISNQLKLISAFKKKGCKIILTRGKLGVKPNPVMDKLWGDEYHGNGNRKKFLWNISIIDELKNTNPDKIIHKEAYSAFYNTDLEKYCKKNKITELYFCGISSGVCVYFSAVDAVYRRIQPYLVKDASGSVSDKQHKTNIGNFKTAIGPVLTTKEILEGLK
jgi:nicotinamidase-related amidase